MKTFNMSVNCMPVEIIGFGGENDVTEVICDFSAWAEEFGQGAISLAVRRPADIDPYLAVLTVDGTAAHWMITDVETSYKGVGEAQWIYTVGEQVKKSAVFGFCVERSLNSATVELPEAYQTWFDNLVALGADIHEVAEKVYEATGHYPKIENGYWYLWDVTNETWVNTGQQAQGEEGAPGVGVASTVLNADYTLTITLTDGTSYTTPSIRGATGNGIASTVLNSDYTLTITFTDGTSYTTPSIRGAQGIPGQDYVITSADYDEIAGRVDTMIAGERQAALDDIDAAKTDAISDITAEGTTQKGLVTSEGTTQKGLVTAEGTTQVGLVTAKGQEVIQSIPSDYSELSDDVSELKSDFTQLTNIPVEWTDGKYYLANSNYADYQYTKASNRIYLEQNGRRYHLKFRCSLTNSSYVVFKNSSGQVIYTKNGSSSAVEVVEGSTKDYTGDDEIAYILLSMYKDNAPQSGVKGVGEVYLTDLVNNEITAVDFSAVQNVKITKDQADFVKKELGTNLFNKDASDITTGKELVNNANWSEYTNASVEISGYTEVEPSTQYSHRLDAGMGAAKSGVVGYYDKDKNKISIETAESVNSVISFTTPSTCKYVRFNVLISTASTFMLVKGSTLPTNFVPYVQPYYVLNGIVINPDDIYLNLNPLYEKTAVFDGDSICNGSSAGDSSSGYASRIGIKNSMDWHNVGVGGGTITSGASSTSHYLSDYIDTIHTNYPSLDYLILEGGVNDADKIGSISASNFGSYSMTDYEGVYDKTTFCGAVETLFYKALNYYPHAKIGFVIAQKMGYYSGGYDASHYNRKGFFDAIISICEKWGIPYINLWDGSPLNPKIPSQYDRNMTTAENIEAEHLYTDGQHLTSYGYDYIAPMIEAWMKTL